MGVEQIVAPLAPYDETACRTTTGEAVTTEARAKLFDGALPEAATAPT